MCMNSDQLQTDGAKPLLDLFDSLGGWKLLNAGLNDSDTNWQDLYGKIVKSGFSSDHIMSLSLSLNPNNNSIYIIDIAPPHVQDFNRYYGFFPQGLNNHIVKAYLDYMKEFTILLGANESDAEKEMLEFWSLNVNFTK